VYQLDLFRNEVWTTYLPMARWWWQSFVSVLCLTKHSVGVTSVEYSPVSNKLSSQVGSQGEWNPKLPLGKRVLNTTTPEVNFLKRNKIEIGRTQDIKS
jgi:hypothetical protein